MRAAARKLFFRQTGLDRQTVFSPKAVEQIQAELDGIGIPLPRALAAGDGERRSPPRCLSLFRRGKRRRHEHGQRRHQRTDRLFSSVIHAKNRPFR